MAKKLNPQLEKIIPIFFEEKYIDLQPCEYAYVSTAARIIREEIEKWYAKNNYTEFTPSINTVKCWIYGECPGWVVNVLTTRLSERKKSLTLV